jgi:hypothetical protein
MQIGFVPWWLTLTVPIVMTVVFLSCVVAWQRLPEEACRDSCSTSDISLDRDS